MSFVGFAAIASVRFSGYKMVMGFSFTHLLILVLLILIFMKPARLGNLIKSIGQGTRSFKDELNTIDAESENIDDDHPPKNRKNS